jgi:hypothetical protein
VNVQAEIKKYQQDLKYEMSSLSNLKEGGFNKHQVEELVLLIGKAQNSLLSEDLNELYDHVLRLYFKSYNFDNSILLTQLIRVLIEESTRMAREKPIHIKDLLIIAKDFNDTDTPTVLIADSIIDQGHIKILNSEQKYLVHEVYENHFKKALSFGRFFDTQETEVYRLENYLFLSRAIGLPPEALVDLLNQFIMNNKVSRYSIDTYVAFTVRLLVEIMKKYRSGQPKERVFVESSLANLFQTYINGSFYNPYDKDHNSKTSPFKNALIKNMVEVYRGNVEIQEKIIEILSSTKQVIYPLLEDLSPLFSGSVESKNLFQYKVIKKLSDEILNFAKSHRSSGFQGENDVRLKSYISMIGVLKEHLTPQDFYDRLVLILSEIEKEEKLISVNIRMARFEKYAPYRYLVNLKQSFNESLVNISPQNRCQLLLRFRL